MAARLSRLCCPCIPLVKSALRKLKKLTAEPSPLPWQVDQLPRRKSRSKEKYLIAAVVCLILVACFGTVFFLPDMTGSENALRVAVELHRAGSGLFMPPPLEAGDLVQIPRPHGDLDFHRLQDKARLAEKVRGDADIHKLVLERPRVDDKERGDEKENAIPVPDSKSVLKFGGADRDPVMRERRDKVREMMVHSWKNYVEFAWGENELRPVTRVGHSAGIFGKSKLGATIVDAMDTLYIMGLMDEFNEGRKWIESELSLEGVNTMISVFETNIRFVGGLLTCYALTGDKMFLDKAVHFADKLLPAFNTPSGIPYALVNTATGAVRNYAWASGSSSILSEAGTLHLEFAYLSNLTGNPVYKEKIERIRTVLKDAPKPKGLYPNYINPKTGRFGQNHVSFGALGDSFYEYLFKAWLQSNKTDEVARQMYVEAIEALTKHILKVSKSGLYYVSDMKYERLEHKMDHLACFAGGLYALGAKHIKDSTSEYYMRIGAEITATCHKSYDLTATKLGPESFRFEGDGSSDAKAMRGSEKYYLLRPETVESYLILWRLTGDKKYREWGWEFVQALEKHCRVEHGYSGVKNVYSVPVVYDDVQQSFFLAETLKYLYLLFSDDKLISLDQWVFNTEAHPLPIFGVKTFDAQS